MSTEVPRPADLSAALSTSVPRRARLSKSSRQTYAIFFPILAIFVVGIIAGFAFLGRYTQAPIAELQKRGIKAEGKVTRISSKRIWGSGGSYQYTAHFQFPLAGGGTATGSFPTVWPGHTEVGDSVPVIYLPEDPHECIVAHEITQDDFRSQENSWRTAIQAGQVLAGIILTVFTLALLPTVWGDYRQLRLARWGELVQAEVTSVTSNKVIYTYELPKLGRIEESIEYHPEFKTSYRVGDRIPILYSPRNPRRREREGSLNSVEFLPPKK